MQQPDPFGVGAEPSAAANDVGSPQQPPVATDSAVVLLVTATGSPQHPPPVEPSPDTAGSPQHTDVVPSPWLTGVVKLGCPCMKPPFRCCAEAFETSVNSSLFMFAPLVAIHLIVVVEVASFIGAVPCSALMYASLHMTEHFEKGRKTNHAVLTLTFQCTGKDRIGVWQDVRMRGTDREFVLMAFQKGEVCQCPDPACGCEMTVTKGAQPGQRGDQLPTCCCSKTMVKKR